MDIVLTCMIKTNASVTFYSGATRWVLNETRRSDVVSAVHVGKVVGRCAAAQVVDCAARLVKLVQVQREGVGCIRRRGASVMVPRRVKRAAYLLRTERLPISRIAVQVGIPDEFYFRKLFKRHLHIPPATYRREFGIAW